jgi:hypothetical protein
MNQYNIAIAKAQFSKLVKMALHGEKIFIAQRTIAAMITACIPIKRNLFERWPQPKSLHPADSLRFFL